MAESFPPTIGPYRVLTELGRGGAGRVFLGEETGEGFVRRVAVKVLTGALADGEAREHFRTEGRLLAGLEHPGIARLYDTGTTADGVPYLAMEYVDGTDLMSFADARGLGARGRVALFLQVLEAVQFAHRHLIVHRDLKPANLLVDAEGRVKLLDFGIAKLIDESSGDAFLTRTGRRWLTPAYAAPEQVRGETTTTAADIYSLGVVLYELLSGHRPHETTDNGIEAALLTTDPVPPSRAPSGGTRSTVPPVARDLEGDLDAIVLYALRREPEARYRSVEAFAEDLTRHLEGFPVAARQGTRRYRWTKFASRNRRFLAAGAAVFLALSGGLGVALWQARRAAAAQTLAEHRFTDLQGLARAMIFEVSDAIAPLDGSGPVVELTIDRALEYLDRLQADGDQTLLEDLAAGYERVGRIAGEMPSFGGGTARWEKGVVAFERGVALRRQVAGSAEATVDARMRLGRSLLDYCGALRLGRDVQRAGTVCGEAVAIFDELSTAHADRWDLRFELASALIQKHLVEFVLEGDAKSGPSPDLDRTAALWSELEEQAPEPVRSRGSFGWGLRTTADWLRYSDRPAECIRFADWATARTDEAPPDEADNPRAVRLEDRAAALEVAARCHWDLGQPAVALDRFEAAYAASNSLQRRDRRPHQRIFLVSVLERTVALCGELGEVARGERALTAEARLIDEAVADWKPDTVTWSRARLEGQRGRLYGQTAARPGLSRAVRHAYRLRARTAFRQAIESFESLVRDGQDPYGVAESLSECRQALAEVSGG